MTTELTWLVTGASRGLGQALTTAALEAGHRVLATVRGEHSLPSHERLLVHRLDVRDRDGAHAAVARAQDHFGRLDVLVNNAGYGLVGAVEEVAEEEARQIIDTDLLGALWLTQAALPVMRAQGAGHIVQISTVGAVGTMPTLGLYNAAKWGLEGFSEALAAEVSRFGIRVTIAEIGGIDTDWATGSMQFAAPIPAYDELRNELFGSPVVPWPSTGGTGGGTPPQEVATAILRHVTDPQDDRLRLVVGDDAAEQVLAALRLRHVDYQRDERFHGAF
ncbi:SDR family NAD(P)-dependent oxidoreductase [Blastococcus sp. TML/M2B]|uniref:SDR family NAD(P)-dependent oxidoreductase n=1 Tax=unclassified Blastococcus TaxID=2619396 RepID=UPI00190C26D6|nr:MULTISPECIES: SDR family NAD(P)-dependent oxidoreductase [unclassified Blastococcus]MBN1092274.1 SDR family NAD(P)-dependent oxidoreductase [Blastococcus sp. TML/M2B]MBN1097628.1 SDR family NAD(P)-dependent oxidoreductase [Blastococcus sp. TML/C7B]